MQDWRPSRPRAGLLVRGRHVARAAIPATVWLLAVCVVVLLGQTLPMTGQLTGIVDAAQGNVTAPVDGRIAAVLVALHQEVEAGQVLVRLDDHDIRLRMTQATCELERLRADMAREAADLDQQARTLASSHGLEAGVEQRRLVSAVEAAQLGALAIRTELEEARIRAQGAAVEADRLGALATQGMVGEPELLRVRTERDALQKRITELTSLHAEHLQRIDTAQQRAREFAPGDVATLPLDTALAPMRWRLKAQEAMLERISLDAQQLDLRAPAHGRVSAVLIQPGEWTAAGRMLVSVVDPNPRRILAYAPDALRTRLQPQLPVRVHRGDSSLLGTSTIQSISPTTVKLPERLWRDPQRAEWGFEIVVAATGAECPGERVALLFGP